MIEGGWDIGNVEDRERWVLPGQSCDDSLDRIDKHPWIKQQWSPTTISTKFWSTGRATLAFNNCNKEGEITILVDGREVAKSKPVGEATAAAFNVDEGTVLEIKADNRAITRLLRLYLACGKLFFLTN